MAPVPGDLLRQSWTGPQSPAGRTAPSPRNHRRGARRVRSAHVQQTAQAAHTPRTRDWAPTFLHAFGDTHLVSDAAKLAGIGRRTAYDRRLKDPEFATAWAAIEEHSTDLLESEAYRRAVDGWRERPILDDDGHVVGEVRKFSDALLMFLLKARRPAVYREHHQVEITDSTPVALDSLGLDLKALSDRDLANLAGILRRASPEE
jgi:hypothetical protein